MGCRGDETDAYRHQALRLRKGERGFRPPPADLSAVVIGAALRSLPIVVRRSCFAVPARRKGDVDHDHCVGRGDAAVDGAGL
jgi:hypothetical protein